MLLQPRKFTWKTKQKSRRCRTFRRASLSYGECGLRLLQPYRVSAKRIFRFKIFLKRATKKPDLTRRSLWVNLFPHLPLTKKTKGMRMGKGIGKLSAWFTQLNGGTFVVEFYNLRRGRSRYFAKQIAYKLPVSSVFCEHAVRSVKVHSSSRANAMVSTFL